MLTINEVYEILARLVGKGNSRLYFFRNVPKVICEPTDGDPDSGEGTVMQRIPYALTEIGAQMRVTQINEMASICEAVTGAKEGVSDHFQVILDLINQPFAEFRTVMMAGGDEMSLDILGMMKKLPT